jgi:hypothetical protein
MADILAQGLDICTVLKKDVDNTGMTLGCRNVQRRSLVTAIPLRLKGQLVIQQGSAVGTPVPGKNTGPCCKQSVDNISISNFSSEMQRSIFVAAQYISIRKGTRVRHSEKLRAKDCTCLLLQHGNAIYCFWFCRHVCDLTAHAPPRHEN